MADWLETDAPKQLGDLAVKRKLEHVGKSTVAVAVVFAAALAFPSLASAQAGHFVGEPTCTDIGTQVSCSGKVAGLGGTTFTLLVSAEGTASVTCTNPAGNVHPVKL
jgi:hypothetical protein